MKFGFRKPSLKKRIAARTSLKRFARHSLGFKAPGGMGWLTNRKKARITASTTGPSKGCLVTMFALSGLIVCMFILFDIVGWW